MNNNSYLPPSANILPWTWDFKIKIAPNGSLKKYKAWFCIRVYIHKKSFIHPIEIYAPVVRWHTIITMLTMTCIFDFKMHAIEYINIFSQSEQKGPLVTWSSSWCPLRSHSLVHSKFNYYFFGIEPILVVDLTGVFRPVSPLCMLYRR